MKLAIGDTVAYSAKFVRAIGGESYGIAELRGTVTEIRDTRKVRVLWEDESEPKLVLISNLAKPGLNTRFSDPS